MNGSIVGHPGIAVNTPSRRPIHAKSVFTKACFNLASLCTIPHVLLPATFYFSDRPRMTKTPGNGTTPDTVHRLQTSFNEQHPRDAVTSIMILLAWALCSCNFQPTNMRQHSWAASHIFMWTFSPTGNIATKPPTIQQNSHHGTLLSCRRTRLLSNNGIRKPEWCYREKLIRTWYW